MREIPPDDRKCRAAREGTCAEAVATAEGYADALATRAEADAARAGLERLGDWKTRRREEYGIEPLNVLDEALGPEVSVGGVRYCLGNCSDLFLLNEYELPYDLLLDVCGNPFRPIAFAPEWRTGTAVLLARQMYDARDFSAMPILADVSGAAEVRGEVSIKRKEPGCPGSRITSHHLGYMVGADARSYPPCLVNTPRVSSARLPRSTVTRYRPACTSPS